MSLRIHLALLLAAAVTAAAPALILAKESTVTTQTQSELAAMTLAEAEAAFGVPVERDRFPLAPELPEFRTDLPDLATPDEVAARAEVQEVTWGHSAEHNRTVWFIERDGDWRYLHHKVWIKGTEF